MKKTRILAALLCMMMVLSIVPMMASAEETTYASVAEIFGSDLRINEDFDLTSTAYKSGAQGTFVYSCAGSSHGADGAVIDAALGGPGMWRYNMGETWGPVSPGVRAVYFQAKVDSGKELQIYQQLDGYVDDAGKGRRSYFKIGATAFSNGSFSKADYVREGGAGTGWVEYFMLSTANEAVSLYAKGITDDGKWVKVLQLFGFSSSDKGTGNGLYFAGYGNVKRVTFYNQLKTFENVEDVLGYDVIAGTDFNFTASNAQTLYATSGCGCDFNAVSFDTTTGMTLGETSPRWRIGSNNSSSLGAKKAIYFRMKVSSAKASKIYIHVPDTAADQDVYGVSVATTGVTSMYTPATMVNAFAPGESVAEYLAVDNQDGTGMHLYGKSANLYNNKWVEIYRATGIYGTLSSSSEFYITEAGSIQQLILYRKDERISYDSVEAIVNSGYVPAKELNFTLPNASSLYTGTGYTTAKMTFDTTNGMTPNDGYWRYVPESYYSPVAEGRVVYWRAKVTSGNTLTTYIKMPGDTTEQCWGLKMNESGFASSYAATTDTIDTSFVPGTDWVDLLAVRSLLGIKIYASNGDKWYQVAELSKTGKVSNSCGIYFAGQGAYVQKAAVYRLGNFNTFESVLGYTGVPEQSFDSFMRYDLVKDYSPVENRFFTVRAKAGEGKTITIYAHDYHTEKNVYAFRITPEALLEPAYKNSANPAHVTMTTGFVPGTDWQEYLVAENQAGTGIVVYVKLENGNWYNVLEVVGHAYETPYSNTYGLFIPAVEGCELSATIYSRDSIVLANGDGNAVYDGDTLSTPAALRVKGNNATGKLLVVSYKGDDMAKAQIMDAASLTADGTLVDASVSGATKVKVFLWDSFTSLNRQVPAITLGL